MNNPLSLSEAAADAHARRAAKRVGLVAKKSTWRTATVDNQGGYQLLEPFRNWIVAGERFDLTADEAIQYCSSD